LKQKISQITKEVDSFQAKSLEEVVVFRLKYLAKNGLLNALFNDFKNVSETEKKEVGRAINNLKIKIKEKISAFSEIKKQIKTPTNFDLSRPAKKNNLGSRHPLSLVESEIVKVFSSIGFNISEGPEIEDDWHNFTALNTPKEHPARDMQDTFFIQTDPDILLRSHTSSVQVRHMQNNQPPIRTISPGRVYRNEAISARAHCLFHQVEGLYIDTNVTFADLKQTLLFFAKELFGEKSKIRLRPSYFPFTEPSAEVDVSCNICSGKGCAVCKYTGYLEILGCGMIDPNVLDNCGIDSKKYTGYAFGMGIERIAMLKYRVNDLRLFYENDVRFLNQFSSEI
jgi:phenylalanyl-tRNA synthetase alpha chain|tara:strand:- start:478 stop:1494 length:1017 start_codon:yes stop_codon:yes gene_type:complete